jgi:hypothetical protein
VAPSFDRGFAFKSNNKIPGLSFTQQQATQVRIFPPQTQETVLIPTAMRPTLARPRGITKTCAHPSVEALDHPRENSLASVFTFSINVLSVSSGEIVTVNGMGFRRFQTRMIGLWFASSQACVSPGI